MDREIWLLCATLAVSFLYYLSHLRCRSGAAPLPPGPRPLPLIGNLLDLRGNLHHTLARLARAHGPVMRLKLGLTTAVVVSSRDAASEAFTKQDRRLTARAVPDGTHALGFADRSTVWLPSSNPRWKTQRGIMATHIFSPRSLAAARGVRERKVRELVAYFRGRAGQEVDFGNAVYSAMLNLVSSVFWSADVVVVGAESSTGIRELMEDLIQLIAKPNVSDLFPFLRSFDLQGMRQFSADRLGKIMCILDEIIERRLAEVSTSEDRQSDFLDALLELKSTGKITRDNVMTILFDVFVAGTDTVSITVEWAMAELLRHPSIMANVRAELKEVLGGKEIIDEPDTASLPYLQAVAKETLRLHPVAPLLIPHQATEDGVMIGGFAVPKGCTVLFNAWAIMRDPAAWERPDEFVPERFLNRAVEVDFKGKDFEFIPFGAGRRLCPGLPMAERLVPFILASVLHAFEWRLPDGMPTEQLDVSEKFTSANVMDVPLKVAPVVIT